MYLNIYLLTEISRCFYRWLFHHTVNPYSLSSIPKRLYLPYLCHNYGGIFCFVFQIQDPPLTCFHPVLCLRRLTYMYLYVLHQQVPFFSCFWLKFSQLEVPARIWKERVECGWDIYSPSFYPARCLWAGYFLQPNITAPIKWPTLIAVATHSELQESLPTCTPLGLGILIAHTTIIPRVSHYPLWFPYPLFSFL